LGDASAKFRLRRGRGVLSSMRGDCSFYWQIEGPAASKEKDVSVGPRVEDSAEGRRWQRQKGNSDRAHPTKGEVKIDADSPFACSRLANPRGSLQRREIVEGEKSAKKKGDDCNRRGRERRETAAGLKRLGRTSGGSETRAA